MRAMSERSHDLLPEPVDLARAAERHQRHLAALARLEADGRARRDVEAKPARLVTIEAQRGGPRVSMSSNGDAGESDRSVQTGDTSSKHVFRPRSGSALAASGGSRTLKNEMPRKGRRSVSALPGRNIDCLFAAAQRLPTLATDIEHTGLK